MDAITNVLKDWDKEVLLDSSLVYDSKKLVNQLNNIIPVFGEYGLKYNADALDSSSDWSLLNDNSIYVFKDLGKNAPALGNNKKGILIVVGDKSNEAQFVFTPHQMMYKTEGTWQRLLNTDDLQNIVNNYVKTSDTTNWQKQKIFADNNWKLTSCPSGTDFGKFLQSSSVPVGFSIVRDDNKAYDFMTIKESSDWIYAIGIVGSTDSSQLCTYRILNDVDQGYQYYNDMKGVADSQAKMLDNINNQLVKLNGTQGPAGITPTIDDKGHWKIGDTTTQYSAGIIDFNDSATLIDINTDKAQYYPSEKVIFHATSVSGHGHLVIKYYNLNNLIATKDIYYGTSEISWSWFLPSTDNVGYSVVINNYVGEDNETNYRFAINVSSDPYNYPIMGFLSKYDIDSPVQRKEVLDYMNRLHINLVQFYDWFDLHSLPLPVSSNGDSVQVSNTWTDIGNRLTRKKVIEDYCNLTKEHAMKPLAYMAMNGSDTNQSIHGLSAEMFLYDDNSKSLDHVYKTLDKSKGWGKYNLYNTNWMNNSWQDYIDNQMCIVRDNMPFDGWHIDMFGNPGNKYDSNGNELSSSTLESGIHYFIDKAGTLGWDIGVNSVGEYGITDIKPVTALKYLYTEVWDNRKTYDDMFKLVRGLTESTDSNKNKKGVIIAAYMDYDYAKNNSGKDFNIDGIILADLVIMASGGTHLEMGEHMLCNEYFPNSSLNLPAQLKSDYLPSIYDFFVAFKEIIGLGHQVDSLATIDNGSVNSLQSGEVCGISYGNDKDYLGLSLINLKTANTDWRDTNATCSVTAAENVKVTINLEVATHDWYYFDLEHLEPQKIDVGADGIVNIPELHYFGFILGVPNKQ